MKYLILDVSDEVPFFHSCVVTEEGAKDYLTKWCEENNEKMPLFPKPKLLIWKEDGTRHFIEIVKINNEPFAGVYGKTETY